MYEYVTIVDKFTKALDADDYTAVYFLLAENCAYDTGKDILIGREKIIESYRETSNWVHSIFDEVIYESEIEQTLSSDKLFLIRFTDRIRKGKFNHVHRCNQWVTLKGPLPIITSIKHYDIEDEATRLNAFFEKCGVHR